MVAEVRRPGPLPDLVAPGEATAPVDQGMPELIPDLAPGLDTLSELVIADRRHQRGR